MSKCFSEFSHFAADIPDFDDGRFQVLFSFDGNDAATEYFPF